MTKPTTEEELRVTQLELWGLTSRMIKAAEDVKRKREEVLRLIEQRTEEVIKEASIALDREF